MAKSNSLIDELNSQIQDRTNFPNILPFAFDSLERQLATAFSLSYGVRIKSSTEVDFLVLAVQGKTKTTGSTTEATDKKNIVFIANKVFSPPVGFPSDKTPGTMTLSTPSNPGRKLVIRQVLAAGAFEVDGADLSEDVLSVQQSLGEGILTVTGDIIRATGFGEAFIQSAGVGSAIPGIGGIA